MAMTEGYIKGYDDGLRDSGVNGWNPSCPTGHSAAHCKNYQSGYNAGWAVAIGKHAIAYKAGYEQGVNDAKPTGSLTLGKGPLVNTTGFGQGYVDGYCSLQPKGNYVGSDAD